MTDISEGAKIRRKKLIDLARTPGSRLQYALSYLVGRNPSNPWVRVEEGELVHRAMGPRRDIWPSDVAALIANVLETDSNGLYRFREDVVTDRKKAL
jgi:hypothetical protein